MSACTLKCLIINPRIHAQSHGSSSCRVAESNTMLLAAQSNAWDAHTAFQREPYRHHHHLCPLGAVGLHCSSQVYPSRKSACASRSCFQVRLLGHPDAALHDYLVERREGKLIIVPERKELTLEHLLYRITNGEGKGRRELLQ